jgi:hypothetical protein
VNHSCVGKIIRELDAELVMIRSCLEAFEHKRPHTSRRRRRKSSSGRRFWTAAELRDLRKLYPDARTSDLAPRFGRSTTALSGMAYSLGLHKSEAYLATPEACRLRRGDNVGASFRFQRGHVPANKGLRRPGYGPGRMRETQFRKGERPHTWVPVGTEVRDDDGYLKRKIGDDRTKPPRFNWRYVHTMTWEARNGPVPSGHAVAFKNGDKTDIREENLEIVSREELMRRNSVHRLPPALAEVVLLRARLVRQINRRMKA